TADATPVYHLFEYRCDSKSHRDKLADAFKAAGIGFGYHYPVPIHKQKAYPKHNMCSFPVAERLAETLISLPIHPSITKEQVDSVCNVIANL
ncbi:MAG: DegT/DnrJ/EryC1/StrS family aminotransferase, partial [Phycisphaerae bacterium]